MRLNVRLLAGGIVMLGTLTVHAQQPASFRQTLRSLQNDPILRSLSFPDTGTIKCGTPYILAIRSQWARLSPQSRAGLARIFQRPNLQKSRLSSSGKFRIHYDSTGSNQPALIGSGQDVPNSYEAYIDSVAAILDHVWTIEIDSLGYDPPLEDGSQGGGPEYDVYIEGLGAGVFGYTDWDPNDPGALVNGGNVRYPTYMGIDKDFLSLRTPGMDGLKVTCAHEFHHAIQIGAYGYWSESDFYFNELTSSWMEDVVYTQVNDYYFDVVNYFRSFRDGSGYPLSFTYYSTASFAGYERSIWGHFLAKRFGRYIMREIWAGILTAPFLQSARAVFSRHGTDWNTEFALFTYWNYFTGDRADTVHFYPEGNHYPRFLPNLTADFTGATTRISAGAYPLSSAMYEFRFAQDTVTAIAANTDVDAILSQDNSPRSFEVDLSRGILSSPHVALANGFNVGTSAADLSKWHSFYVLSSTQSDIQKLQLQASPNPFRMTQASELMLPLYGINSTSAKVYFLSSSLTLAYSGDFAIKNQFGNQFIAIPSGALQSRLNSGVYFVIAKVDGSEFRWKVAIIR